jgi:hypothetical protein
MEKSLSQLPAGQPANVLKRHRYIPRGGQADLIEILETERGKGGGFAEVPLLGPERSQGSWPVEIIRRGPMPATARLSLSIDSAWPAVGSAWWHARLTGPTYIAFKEEMISSVMPFT